MARERRSTLSANWLTDRDAKKSRAVRTAQPEPEERLDCHQVLKLVILLDPDQVKRIWYSWDRVEGYYYGGQRFSLGRA